MSNLTLAIKGFAAIAIIGSVVLFVFKVNPLPDTADEFNGAANRLELTEILLTSPDEYKQYNDKFWCYHKKNNTDVWEKGRAICKGETATSPNCNAVMGGTALCGIVHKPSKNNTQFNSGF